ncbi:hypothetical protein TSUD_72810 [Trifolium subterraneum]|uniref:Telomeric single stranded DNA binding POT1/Cdc13 domain-containing protein n=1 Tax=Trifolium subterraneum TaxID=3900 RepID=A0A2Z6M2B4_TRISU|nr:hypothetical protein TSUD_72810 [Trifolium subterraneum]
MPIRRRRLVKLADVGTCVGTSVDIIAVVNDVGLPKTTRGTDLCCTIRLIDQTKYQSGTSINIFIQTPQAFPRFASAGDIILLCNVKICLLPDDNEINATVYRAFSYFALFKGRDAVAFAPYQTYSFDNSTVTLTDVDRKCILDLRDWLTNFQIPQASGDFPMLREIKEGHLNLACKILHCCKAANQWFVYVWDGTDTPPNVINAILKVDSASGLWHGDFTPQSKIRYTPSDDCLITERQRFYHDRMLLKSGNNFIGMIPQSISLSEGFIPITIIGVIVL